MLISDNLYKDIRKYLGRCPHDEVNELLARMNADAEKAMAMVKAEVEKAKKAKGEKA